MKKVRCRVSLGVRKTWKQRIVHIKDRNKEQSEYFDIKGETAKMCEANVCTDCN